MNVLAFALLQAHWRDDRDSAERPSLEHACTQAGFDPRPLLDAAVSEFT